MCPIISSSLSRRRSEGISSTCCRRRARASSACCRCCAAGSWPSMACRCSRCASAGLQGAARGRTLADREQNLTWTDELGDDNHIVAGRWWDARGYWQAARVPGRGISAGDEPQAWRSTCSSISVARASRPPSPVPARQMGQLPPELLRGISPRPAGRRGGQLHDRRLSDARRRGHGRAGAALPSVSIFNIGDLLAQARAVIDQGGHCRAERLLFTVLASLTVLLSQVQATREERRQEIAILRVLGARRPMIPRQRAGGVLAARRAGRRARRQRRGHRRRVARAYAGSELPLRCGAMAARGARRCARHSRGGLIATRPMLSVSPRAVLY